MTLCECAEYGTRKLSGTILVTGTKVLVNFTKKMMNKLCKFVVDLTSFYCVWGSRHFCEMKNRFEKSNFNSIKMGIPLSM